MNIILRAKSLYQRIISWMQNPYSIPDTSTWEKHTCKNCSTEYTGNYCPQCGQSCKVERFTIKSVISNIMELWGWGNRSMPRTLLHLFTRPGFMINDYLAGRRQPYFPPVKLLFITAAIFSIFTFAIAPQKNQDEEKGSIKITSHNPEKLDSTKVDGQTFIIDRSLPRRSQKIAMSSYKVSNYLNNDKHRAFTLLLIHSALAICCFILFRRNRQGIKLTLYEHFFCQMYIAAQLLALGTIYSIITWEKDSFYSFPVTWTIIVIVIDFLQLFGGKFIPSFFKILFALFLSAILCLIFLAASIGVIGLVS